MYKLSALYLLLFLRYIQGFKLKNENENEKRNGLFAISPMQDMGIMMTSEH